MNKFLLCLVAAVGLVFCDSCTHRLTDFTVISTKNVPIGEGVHTDFQKGSKRVKGKDTAHQILIIPLGYPNMKEAIDRAIEQIPGAVGLVDGVVKSSMWTCFLYGQSSYIVEGTPLFPSEYNYEEASYGRPGGVQKQGQNTVSPASLPNHSEGETMMFFHTVKDGETLVTVAQMYGVKVGDIIKWNKLSENSINKGDKLTIRIKD